MLQLICHYFSVYDATTRNYGNIIRYYIPASILRLDSTAHVDNVCLMF